MSQNQKIQTPESIPLALVEYRARCEKIVFTNGCFDLLHLGHVQYLQEARSCGDCLVLGLNSDASIRMIKGEKRPILSQDQRAGVMAALECVDFVVVFDEPDPLQLILLVRPDILVKGADWGEDEIIGRKEVEEQGGRVIRIPLVPHISTSLIIQTILNRFGMNANKSA